ncbi:MAG: hypothetical protein ACHQ6U_05355 [Thermodesulfobacteriota bacterium]
MECAFERRKKINSILAIYSGFLNELSETLGQKSIFKDYPAVRERAFRVIDETLSEGELDALLMIKGELSGRFPGVKMRIKELLRKEILDSLLSDKK